MQGTPSLGRGGSDCIPPDDLGCWNGSSSRALLQGRILDLALVLVLVEKESEIKEPGGGGLREEGVRIG